MELKIFTIQDKEIVKPFFRDVFTKEPWNDDWSDSEQLDAYMTEFMGNQNSLTLGYMDGDRLIGLSMGEIRHWYTGTEYCIQELCIDTELQGKGYGSAFLQEIEKYLLDHNIVQIYLQTERHVPAYGFYMRRGFEEIRDQVSLAKWLPGD